MTIEEKAKLYSLIKKEFGLMTKVCQMTKSRSTVYRVLTGKSNNPKLLEEISKIVLAQKKKESDTLLQAQRNTKRAAQLTAN